VALIGLASQYPPCPLSRRRGDIAAREAVRDGRVDELAVGLVDDGEAPDAEVPPNATKVLAGAGGL
jgi:hypothetical protein